MGMVPQVPTHAEPDQSARELARLRSGIDPSPPIPPVEVAVRRASPRAAQPGLRCGACHALVPLPANTTAVRCPTCKRRLHLPARVPVACIRCGKSRTLQLTELTQHRLCANCSQPLTVGDVVLRPHHHRRHHTPSQRAEHRRSNYADAAWAVLMLGVVVLITLVVLARQ
jgi:DNA-directed RNA polymerase subunit RPC12/RpoP